MVPVPVVQFWQTNLVLYDHLQEIDFFGCIFQMCEIHYFIWINPQWNVTFFLWYPHSTYLQQYAFGDFRTTNPQARTTNPQANCWRHIRSIHILYVYDKRTSNQLTCMIQVNIQVMTAKCPLIAHMVQLNNYANQILSKIYM